MCNMYTLVYITYIIYANSLNPPTNVGKIENYILVQLAIFILVLTFDNSFREGLYTSVQCTLHCTLYNVNLYILLIPYTV